MTATKRQIRLDIVATDTHCGAHPTGCPRLRAGEEHWHCTAFGRTMPFGGDVYEWPQRLPQCTAAEGAGREGGERC